MMLRVCLRLDAERSLEVRHTKGLFERGDGAVGEGVEELVDVLDSQSTLEVENSLSDALQVTGLGSLLGEAEKLLCKRDTKLALELEWGEVRRGEDLVTDVKTPARLSPCSTSHPAACPGHPRAP